MNDIEKYQFDLNGYLLVENLLEPEHVKSCLAAVDALEPAIQAQVDMEPKLRGFGGTHFRFLPDQQCHAYKSMSGGIQYIVDDFPNASSAFDALIGHEPTMKYVRELSAGPHKIGNSEIRYRYKSNSTPTHMGGRMDARNHFDFVGRNMYDSSAQVRAVRDFNLLAVRVLYALQDLPVEQGPLCVVPGTHKSNYFSPYSDDDPTKEPGMIPLPMKAGDAIIFTENLRHGGFPNLSDSPRKTLHLMFAPDWVGSQSPIHWNDRVYVSQEAWDRYDDKQRALLPQPTSAKELELRSMLQQKQELEQIVSQLQEEIERLRSLPAPLAQIATTAPEPEPRPTLLSSMLKSFGIRS